MKCKGFPSASEDFGAVLRPPALAARGLEPAVSADFAVWLVVVDFFLLLLAMVNCCWLMMMMIMNDGS